MTTDTETTKQREILLTRTIDALQDLMYAYDPTEIVGIDQLDELIWNLENEIIDATFEVEEMVAAAVST